MHRFSWLVHLSVKDDKWVVDSSEKLPEGRMAQLSVYELIEAEEIVRADERVRKLAADVGKLNTLPIRLTFIYPPFHVGVAPDQIYADGWSVGYDDRFPEKLRLQQCLMFARFGKDENIYAHPLDFIPVIDSNSKKVIHIDFPSHQRQTCEDVGDLVSRTVPPSPRMTYDRKQDESRLHRCR